MFLKTLESAGQGTKTLWSQIIRQVYDRFVLARNFCSLGIVFWVIGQLWYNGTKIIDSSKQRAFNTSMGTILRAFCCRIAMFVTNPKYSQVPGTREDIKEKLQEQEIAADNIGTIWITLTQGDNVMQGPTSQDMRE